MARVLTEAARERLEELPGWAQSAPEHQALCLVFANEGERQRLLAREIRDGLIPINANELTLPFWETMLKMTVKPSGLTVGQRRDLVIARLLQTPPDPAGTTWEQRITAFIGPSWSYVEEDTVENPQTIRVTVPWKPGSQNFVLARRVIERERPAAWLIIVQSEEGFILDLSQLDAETFGNN